MTRNIVRGYDVENACMWINSIGVALRGDMKMWKRNLIGLIRSVEQTKDKSPDPVLRTRYYRLTKERAWDDIVETLKKLPNYNVLHAIPNVGEIVIQRKHITGRKQDITVTVVAMGPIKLAIDVYASARGALGDLGATYRSILDINKALDTKFSMQKLDQ